MTKVFIAFLLLLFGCDKEILVSELSIEVIESGYRNNKIILRDETIAYLEGIPFTGTAVSYHPKGELSSTVNYKNGKLNGTSLFYYESGNKRWEVNYKAGRKVNLERIWLDDSSACIRHNNLVTEKTWKIHVYDRKLQNLITMGDTTDHRGPYTIVKDTIAIKVGTMIEHINEGEGCYNTTFDANGEKLKMRVYWAGKLWQEVDYKKRYKVTVIAGIDTLISSQGRILRMDTTFAEKDAFKITNTVYNLTTGEVEEEDAHYLYTYPEDL